MATGQRRSASGAFPLRKMRLSDGADFQRLYRTGRRMESSGLRFYWIPSPDNTTRAASVIRKKTVRLAVTRNHLRRTVREAVRAQMALFPQPCWMLFDLRQFTTVSAARQAANHLIQKGPRCKGS